MKKKTTKKHKLAAKALLRPSPEMQEVHRLLAETEGRLLVIENLLLACSDVVRAVVSERSSSQRERMSPLQTSTDTKPQEKP